MLIILEGPDKSGKSTLAREIVKLGFRYQHFGVPGPDPAREYADFLVNLARPTVCDRFYVGERVYGPILRGTSKLDDLRWQVIERLARLRGAIMVHAATALKVCQERLNRREQREHVTLEQNSLAWANFNRVIQQSRVSPVITYDGADRGSLDQVLRFIELLAPSRYSLAREARRVCTWIGTVIGQKLVIVGERLRDRRGWIHLPFADGGSSYYLLRALREAKVPEELVYVCNADLLTEEEVVFLLKGSYDGPWLALGKQADRKLTTLGVEHLGVPHPAYWKRFHSAETKAYVDLLVRWRRKNETSHGRLCR